jgi:hypothetical protein
MNYDQAKKIHGDFLELSKVVQEKLPKEIRVPDYYDPEQYTICHLFETDLEHLTATYRNYIGCGDYEYTSEPINLETLFKEQA